jgi:hypothetical protein
MRTGYRYLAAAAAIGVIGAVFVAYARAHPVLMMFFSVFVLLPPFVVLFYIGVLELLLGNRSGDGPGRGEEFVRGHPQTGRLHRLEEPPELPSRPDDLAA